MGVIRCEKNLNSKYIYLLYLVSNIPSSRVSQLK